MSSYYGSGDSYFGGNPYGTTSLAQTAFERDLARVQARRRRLNALRLNQRPKDEDNTWFFDRFIPDKLEQGVDEIAESLIYTIPGLYEMGKTMTLDARDLVTRGDITPERSGQMFRQMGQQMYQDIRHPLRHPGYTAMTLFGLGSMGLGTAARAGAAASAYAKVRPTSAAARSLAKMEGMPRSTSGALFHAVPPSMRPQIRFGPERERGNMDPTPTEVQQAQGAPSPQPNRGQLRGLKRFMARRELKGMDPIMASPGYVPNPQDLVRRRELMRGLGIPDPVEEARMAEMAGLGSASRAYEQALPDLRAQDEARRAARDQREAQNRAAREAQAAAASAAAAESARAAQSSYRTQFDRGNAAAAAATNARQARIDQLDLEIQMGQLGGRIGAPELPEGVGLQQLLPGMPPLLNRPGATQVGPPGVPAVGEQLSLLGGPNLPDPGAIGPPLSRAAGRELSMGILRPPPPPPKAAPKTARSPRVAPAAVAAIPEMEGAGPIDYEQLAAAIAAQMARSPDPEGEYIDLPEEPRTPGRPRQEGDFSGPQKAEMVEIAKSWEHTRTDDGGWDVTWAGLPAGRLERALDKNGEEIFYPSLTKEGATENRRKYEITMINPRRTRSGRPFSTKRSITAASDAEAAQIARRLWSEWVVAGRTGGHPKPEGAPVKPPLTHGKFKKKQKPGDTAAAAAEMSWAMKPAQNLGNPEGEAPAEFVEKPGGGGGISEKQLLEDAQVEMELEKERLRQEMEAIEGPSDAELAEIEDGPLDVDPAPPVNPPKAKAKAKAVKGEPLTEIDVAALNSDLAPQLKALGLRYNERGYLSIDEGWEMDDVLAPLGFDASDAFMIEYAIAEAAGDVDPGGKFSMAKFKKALEKDFDPDQVADIFNKLFGGLSGGAPTNAELLSWARGDALRAFFAPRKRPSTTLSARYAAKDEQGNRVFSEQTADQVLLSNNPLVRMAWYTTYGALKALENPYARGGKGNFATRQLRRKIEFEKAEVARINELAAKAGITKEVSRYEAALAEAERTDFSGNLPQVWDTVNRGAMMGILFLKPAYLSANLIGQIGLAMIDHAWNPANVYRSVQLQRALYKDPALMGIRAAKIKKAMGEGAMESLSAGPGFSKRVFQAHDLASRGYAKLLDTPFRDNSFINEAVRQGFDSPEKLARLVDADADSPLGRQFTDIARRANRNMIDYGRMNKMEKQLVRRILIFYPWLKGASIYGARFAAEHPAQFTAAIQVGREGAEEARRDLGALPSFMAQQGVFKVGERNIPGLGMAPEIMNPAAISILGTPGETLSMARAAIAGNVRPSEELAESVTPALTAAMTAFTGTDPFTGAKSDPSQSWLERAGESLFETLPFVRQINQAQRAMDISSGEQDPREVLQPMNLQDVAGRWLGPGFGAAVGRPLGEFALNQRESRKLAAAESRTFESKRESQLSLHKSYRDRAKEEAKRLGINLPAAFDKAMVQRGQREAEIADWEQKNGKSTAYDRLEADMRLLVRRKEYTEAEAKYILNNFAGVSESGINTFRRQLGDAFFGGDVRSYYKKLLNAAGASIDQSW